MSPETAALKDGDFAYTTKYALTSGIRRVEIRHAGEKWIYVGRKGALHQQYRRGDDIFATVEEAQARAKELAERQLAALRRKADELNNIVVNGAKVVE